MFAAHTLRGGLSRLMTFTEQCILLFRCLLFMVYVPILGTHILDMGRYPDYFFCLACRSLRKKLFSPSLELVYACSRVNFWRMRAPLTRGQWGAQACLLLVVILLPLFALTNVQQRVSFAHDLLLVSISGQLCFASGTTIGPRLLHTRMQRACSALACDARMFENHCPRPSHIFEHGQPTLYL